MLRQKNLSDIDNLIINDQLKILNSGILDIMTQLNFFMNKLYDGLLTTLNKHKNELYKMALSGSEWGSNVDIKKHYKRMMKLKKVEYMENNIISYKYYSKLMYNQYTYMTYDNETITKVKLNG